MTQTPRSPFDDPFNALVLEVFRLNGALIRSGDELVAPLGLSSARWQVLGSIVHGEGRLSVAALADNMGLARQSVQRVVNELEQDGLVGFAPNPAHKRAKLVVMTARGQRAFDRATALWAPLAAELAAALGPRKLRQATDSLSAIREQLEQQRNDRNDP
ncbi:MULTISPECIES: MarR family transcriptional regulator [Rhodopseudomonas]|uniref:MarR family transcriptional regulator n=1 Tax=Rhodopseudomonas palustris TaxID=1076 RepID=A0A0D7EKY6_RHOPL|nr:MULTISPECIES: MarR family transcriptional regulator [Rhodopseudomonas]KIZ41473.1 MarR family transcriptional regulator [Rhodopseudomonas palustris]MDF3812435.1 MarR family transcriptional regulator [Rhodopseudomonas sp. BAL398]WOK19434.1 MarR family transcriptional regulator [Rhodopseudomonas sp. BAL398]